MRSYRFLAEVTFKAWGDCHFQSDFLMGTKSNVSRIIQARLRREWYLKVFKKVIKWFKCEIVLKFHLLVLAVALVHWITYSVIPISVIPYRSLPSAKVVF